MCTKTHLSDHVQDHMTSRPHQPQTGWHFALMQPWASRHIGGSRRYPRYTDARKGRLWVAQMHHKRLQAANKTQTLTGRVNVKSLCSTATHVSDQLVGVQKILYHGLSCCTQQQTHIGSKLRSQLLSPPRRCAEHTSQHAQLLSSQRFLPGSFSDEFVGAVLEQSRCCRTRIPSNSDSEVFQDPQRYTDFISDIHFSTLPPSARRIKKSLMCIPMTPFNTP